MTSREKRSVSSGVLPGRTGGNVKTVSGMMGHYSAGFTLDTYAHVTKDTQIQAVNTVSGILTAARN